MPPSQPPAQQSSRPFAPPFDAWLEPVREVCTRAGEAILEHYNGSGAAEHEEKADKSPLTAADLAAHHILLEGLKPLGLPVLSEESGQETLQLRRQWRRYWLVDPLDGTKEFLERTGEFTVNIALVEDSRPSFGVIGVPEQGTVYCGVPGQGAWKSAGGGWESIGTRRLDDGAVVLTSRRHRGDTLQACLDRFAQGVGAVERQYIGSALKFCLLAEGRADFYPRFSPCCEWDTAAGQALLEAAGGKVMNLQGEALRYNLGQDLLNPHFLAVADPSRELWQQLLA